jgi:hypothetical protein
MRNDALRDRVDLKGTIHQTMLRVFHDERNGMGGRISTVPPERVRSLPLPVRDERGEGFVHAVTTKLGRPSPWPSPHSFVRGRGNSFRQQWWYCRDAPGMRPRLITEVPLEEVIQFIQQGGLPSSKFPDRRFYGHHPED